MLSLGKLIVGFIQLKLVLMCLAIGMLAEGLASAEITSQPTPTQSARSPTVRANRQITNWPPRTFRQSLVLSVPNITFDRVVVAHMHRVLAIDIL